MFGAKFFLSKPDKCIDTVHIFLIVNHIMDYENVTNDNFHYFFNDVWKSHKTSEMKLILT